MRLENALARKIGVESFDNNEVLILDHKRGWQPIAISIYWLLHNVHMHMVR